MNILVIDDDENFISWSKVLIEELGGNAICTTSGYEAIQLILLHDIRLVFVDLLMPEIDGVETVHKIRAINQDINIIGVTARTEEANRLLKAGCNDVLLKPTNLKKFIKCIINNCFDNITKNDQTILSRLIAKNAAHELDLINQDFLLSLNETIDTILYSFANGDFENIAMEAHKLKTAAMYGYEQIADIAISLEQMATKNDYNILLKEIFSLQKEITSYH